MAAVVVIAAVAVAAAAAGGGDHDMRARLTGVPLRVFVSVDETTGLSTISFAPPDAGEPFQFTDDPSGEQAMAEAQTIAGAHNGCTVDGPHFHASKPGGPKPRFRRR